MISALCADVYGSQMYPLFISSAFWPQTCGVAVTWLLLVVRASSGSLEDSSAGEDTGSRLLEATWPL